MEAKHILSESKKPDCFLVGRDGNVFVIIGAVVKALKNAGFEEAAKEFSARATSSESYDKVLQICFDYVNVV